MIKAFIFDVGGVLHTRELKFVHKDIMSTLDLTEEEFKQAWCKLIPLLIKGKISEKDFWWKFSKLTNTTHLLPKESLLVREFARRYKINQKVIDIVKNLKHQGYKLAVLSNTCKPHVECNRKHGIYDEFSLLVLSNEVGILKPDPRIYEFTLEKLGVKPEETIYIDDIEEYVVAAERLGMKGMVFKNPSQLKEELSSYKVT